jgi:hypothetical protein
MAGMSERILDGATVQENHERFVRRAVEHEKVWTIWGDDGPLVSESTAQDENDESDDAEPREVYLFFSDEAYAKRALKETWPDEPTYAPEEISLLDLLYRWLPGMHRDNHLAGTNWTGDLIGLEVEPADLQGELLALLPAEVKERYRQTLEELKATEATEATEEKE